MTGTEAEPLVDPMIRDALTRVFDPCCRDKGLSVVDMGLLHRAAVGDDGDARVELVLTTGWCPFATTVVGDIERVVAALPGVSSTTVEVNWDTAWSPERLSPSARSTLRFLPPPNAVRDRTAFVAARRTTPPSLGGEQP